MQRFCYVHKIHMDRGRCESLHEFTMICLVWWFHSFAIESHQMNTDGEKNGVFLCVIQIWYKKVPYDGKHMQISTDSSNFSWIARHGMWNSSVLEMLKTFCMWEINSHLIVNAHPMWLWTRELWEAHSHPDSIAWCVRIQKQQHKLKSNTASRFTRSKIS